MALQKQPYTLPLAQGMQQKKNPKVLTGGITLVENGIHRKEEELRKRYGWTSFPRSVQTGTPAITEADAGATYQDELVIWSKNHIYTYSASESFWYDRGLAYSAAVETRQLISSIKSYGTTDSSYTNGVVTVVYELDDKIHYQIYDYETKAVLVGDSDFGPGTSKPKMLSMGGRSFVFYPEGASNITAIGLEMFFGFPSNVGATVANDFATSKYAFDIVQYGDDRILFAYASAGATIKTKWLDSLLLPKGPPYVDASTPGASIVFLSLIPIGSDETLVIYTQTSALNAHARIISATGAVGAEFDTLLPKTVTVAAGTADIRAFTGHASSNPGERAVIYASYVSGTTTNHNNNLIQKAVLTPSNTMAGAPTVFMRSVSLATRGFIRNGVGFVGIFHSSPLQSTLFISDENGVIVSRHQPLQSGNLTSSGALANVWSAVPDKFEWSMLNKTRIVSETDTLKLYTFSGFRAPTAINIFSPLNVAMTSLDFQNNSNFSSAELGGVMMIVGGALSMYDGISMLEHGFFLFPEDLSVSTIAGSVEAGTYLICALYEWTDARGFIHRSAPSVPVSAVSSGSQQFVTTVPTLRITKKKAPRQNVSIVLYRTQKNQTGPYYRVTSIVTPVENNPAADTVTINDNILDIDLAGRELLYTTGGVLDNAAAFPATFIKVWKQRIILGGLEDSVIQFSKPWARGVPVEFAAENTHEIESDGGPVKALEILDDKLILFKEEKAYHTFGDGPDLTGFSGGFSPFQFIANCDVGCIDQQSTCSIPGAVFFKSLKGYYALGSDLSTIYIGADIEDYNSLYVTSATLFSSENEIRVTHKDGDTLVYNYDVKKWSVFTNHNAVDGLKWKGKFLHVKADGRVAAETPGTWRDDGANYDVVIHTGWQTLSDISGFQRIYRAQIVGDYKSPVSLSLKAAYDFKDTWIDSGQIDMSTPEWKWQFHMKQQKCEAIRFELRAAVSETVLSGEAMSLTAMTLLFGIKVPLSKIKNSLKAPLTQI